MGGRGFQNTEYDRWRRCYRMSYKCDMAYSELGVTELDGCASSYRRLGGASDRNILPEAEACSGSFYSLTRNLVRTKNV